MSALYNHLNLPATVSMPGDKTLTYYYDATGRKLSQVLATSSTVTKKTDYANEYIYENDTLQFINTAEGRYVANAGAVTGGEYQYHLKDHLGNVRLTFTTKLETESNTATLETANEAAEQAKFLRYSNARRVNSTLFDHTNGSATGYSERLNGSANEKFGLAKSVSVMPGDTIKMEVYAKYVDSNTANWTGALNTLMGQISANTAGVVVDGTNYTTSTTTFPYAGLQNTSGSSGTGPKAFLNWLVFDRDYNFITGGYQRMSTSAKEYGQDVAHEKLSGQLVATQPGYVYIYLSNEETTPVDVFFDDFKVTQVKSPVVQSDDYYPFGLAFNSYSRENSEKNNYLCNGKELQDELDLRWLDYDARMYMPEVARMSSIDPHNFNYYYSSPYAYVLNNPVFYLDPTGMDTVPSNQNRALIDGPSFPTEVKPISPPPSQPAPAPAAPTPSAGSGGILARLFGRGGIFGLIFLQGDSDTRVGADRLTEDEQKDYRDLTNKKYFGEGLNQSEELRLQELEIKIGNRKRSTNEASAQDKMLSAGEIKKLEDAGYDVHELKGGKRTGQVDLYKTKDGDVVIKGKGGKGPGDPTGININDL